MKLCWKYAGDNQIAPENNKIAPNNTRNLSKKVEIEWCKNWKESTMPKRKCTATKIGTNTTTLGNNQNHIPPLEKRNAPDHNQVEIKYRGML